jgi:hypothetical protein
MPFTLPPGVRSRSSQAAWADDIEWRWRSGVIDPPSTLLGVTVLGYRDQLVEVEAIAVRPGAPGG